MEATVFNPLQIHLLQMFALDKSQNGLKELKDVLYHHYSAKMENRLDELWQSGKLNQERLDEINEMDLHKLKQAMKIVLDTNSLIVDCAIAAGARYVVTNDHHFDILRQTPFPYVDVIALAEFAELLKRM